LLNGVSVCVLICVYACIFAINRDVPLIKINHSQSVFNEVSHHKE